MVIDDPLTRAIEDRPTNEPLPQLLKRRDRDRLRAYESNLAFYRGEQAPAAGKPASKRAEALVANYTERVIDKATTFTMAGFEISVEPANEQRDADARAAETALREVERNNALDRLDFASEIDAAVLGDGAFRVTWHDDIGVVVTSPDVSGIFPWADPINPNITRRVAHRYWLPAADIATTFGISVFRKDLEVVVEDWTDSEHHVWIGDNARAPTIVEANPYGFVPFVVYPNLQVPKSPFGKSDVADIRIVAEELNREWTRISRLAELSGFPITVLEGVEDSGDLQAVPGAIWNLPPDARGHVLDLLRDGALAHHLEYLERLQRMLHDLSETPRTAFGDNDRDLSGVALEVELLPMLQRVQRKRIIRSDAYATRATMMLALLDTFTATDHLSAGDTVVSWQSPTPRDRAREIDNETRLVNNALTDLETAMDRLGVDDPERMRRNIIADRTEVPGLIDSANEPA